MCRGNAYLRKARKGSHLFSNPRFAGAERRLCVESHVLMERKTSLGRRTYPLLPR